MGIHDNKENNNQDQNLGGANHGTLGGEQTGTETVDTSAMLGFGSNRTINTMSATLGSDYTAAASKALVEQLKDRPESERPRIHVFDKEKITHLGYSAIVASLVSGDDVLYYTIILGATGNKPLEAAKVIAEVNAANQIPNGANKPRIFTLDDAIDGILNELIVTTLKKEFNGKNPVSVEGLVIPNTHNALEAIIPGVAAAAQNALIVEHDIGSGKVADLNITAAKQSSKGIMRYDAAVNNMPLKDEVGNVLRSDFKIDLVMSDPSENVHSPNSLSGKNVLAKIGGYVDAIPERIELPAGPGMPPVAGCRLRPNIVLTSNAVVTGSLGYSLLGIASSLVMLNKNMWLAALTPKDAKRHVGVLNTFTNLENNANGVGSILDLASKKHTAEEVNDLIGKMFTLSPVVSLDVQSFGPQTYYTSVFAAAAKPGAGKAKAKALEEIITVAHNLTNGAFPLDFNPNEVFSTTGVVIPTGVMHVKDGERDIRDIDLTFVAAQSGDINLMNRWAMSNLPKEVTGLDPYLTKVDIISKFAPDAEILQKSVRVTFHGKFLETLMMAVAQAGLDVRYEPLIKLAQSTDIGIMSGVYGNAAVGSHAGFVRANQLDGGPNFQTGYSHIGMGKW